MASNVGDSFLFHSPPLFPKGKNRNVAFSWFRASALCICLTMMGWFSQAFIFGVILLIAGAGIPLMAALNAGLGVRLGNPIPAVFVLFLLALAITAVLTLTNPLPSKAEIVAVPVHYYLGGVFVAFYVLSITWIAPKIGLGNAIFIVLLGQLVAAAIIDHFGLLNVPKAPITTARIVGIGLMVIGIYIAKKPIIDV